jgi:hypothetical protein
MRLNLTESEATVLWAILRNVGGSGKSRQAVESILDKVSRKLDVEVNREEWRRRAERIVIHAHHGSRNEIYVQ